MNFDRIARRKLLGASAGVAGASLAGCSFVDDDDDGVAAETDDPLRISIANPPGSPLNPYISSFASWDWMQDLVWDKLLLPSPFVDEPIPGLATDVERVDSTIWTVTVRDGVEWHDGEPFTAADVAFAYRHYRDGPFSRYSHHVQDMPYVETIEAEDDRTVRFETRNPTPSLAAVTFADLPIFAEHIWEDIDDAYEYRELPVGTGPYELVDYVENERLRFRANEDYFLGEPLVEEIVVPMILDPSVTFTSLNAGEIDTTVRPVPPASVEEFRQDDDLRVVEATPIESIDILLNFYDQPFQEHEFRWVISRAVDADAITERVMLDEAISGSEGYPHPRSPWTAPDVEQPYRPGAAQDRLDELGYQDDDGDGVRESPDGEPLSFTLDVASNESEQIRAAELIAEQLAEVGIEIDVQAGDPGDVASLAGTDEFDLHLDSNGHHLIGDPDQWILNFRYYLWNTEEIPYPEYEELEEEYRGAETLEAQKEALFEIHRLFNQQPTAIPLWYSKAFFAFRPDAHDAWAETPGYGIHHMFSFLPEEARGTAITDSF